MAHTWTPIRELTPDLRGGWIMRVRGRGDLGHITRHPGPRSTTYQCTGRQDTDLGSTNSLTDAAWRLWRQHP